MVKAVTQTMIGQLILFIGFLTPIMGNAATYYVATNGNDSNPGTLSQPFRTVTKGVRVLKAGDTLYVRAGTYNEGVNAIKPARGKSWSSPVTIARYQSEPVTFSPNMIDFGGVSYIIFDGFIIDGTTLPDGFDGLWFGNGTHHVRAINIEVKNVPGNGAMGITVNNSASNIEIIGCKVHGNGKAYADNAIYILGSNNLVERCEIYNNAGAGIQLYDEPTANINNNVIRNNFIHDTSGSISAARVGSGQAQGIIVARANNTLVYNNIIANLKCAARCGTNSGSWGIGLFSWGSNNFVYNNTIYNLNNADGIQIHRQQSGTVIRNNIVYNTLGINDRRSRGAVISNNLCSASGAGCALVGDPKFVNPAAKDFHLQSGSPAIDKGTTLTEVTQDFDGLSRPQGGAYDIGAYEYRTSSPPSAPFNLQVTP